MTTGNEPTVPADPPQSPGDFGNPNSRLRDGNNRFTRDPATAEREARALELRGQGWKLQDIADELGYRSKSAVGDAIRRAMRDVVVGPARELVALEVDRLEALYDEVLEVLLTDQPLVSHGHIIYGDDGNPLVDQELKLKAVDRALRARESFRKLLGVDAPSRVSVEAEQLGREISRLLDTALGPDGDDADA